MGTRNRGDRLNRAAALLVNRTRFFRVGGPYEGFGQQNAVLPCCGGPCRSFGQQNAALPCCAPLRGFGQRNAVGGRFASRCATRSVAAVRYDAKRGSEETPELIANKHVVASPLDGSRIPPIARPILPRGAHRVPRQELAAPKPAPPCPAPPARPRSPTTHWRTPPHQPPALGRTHRPTTRRRPASRDAVAR